MEAPSPLPLAAKSPFELRVNLGKDLPETVVKDALASGDMGFLHSFTTGSTVDGPGVRVVAWTTGCGWRCQYCHNPDTWTLRNGIPVSVAKAAEELRKYRRGLSTMAGGLTISGGDPLMQDRFVVKLLAAARAMQVHTCIETNGYFGEKLSDAELGDHRSRHAGHQDLGRRATYQAYRPLGGEDPGVRASPGGAAQADVGALRARAGSDRRSRRHREYRRTSRPNSATSSVWKSCRSTRWAASNGNSSACVMRWTGSRRPTPEAVEQRLRDLPLRRLERVMSEPDLDQGATGSVGPKSHFG